MWLTVAVASVLALAVEQTAASRVLGGTLRRRALEPPEEFSNVASQALQNLTSEFGQFRNSLASRTSRLTAALQEQERSNHGIELANAHTASEVDKLRHSNGGLRAHAKLLMTENNELRGKLRALSQKLRQAEHLSLTGIEGSNSSETALLVAAEATTAAPSEQVEVLNSPQPARSQAPEAPKVQQPQQDEEAVVAGQQVSDSGLVDAFEGGEESPTYDLDAGGAEDSSSWESLIAISSRTVRQSLRTGDAADELPNAGAAFAGMEEGLVAKMRGLFSSAQQRVRERRIALIGRQKSLNATLHQLEATHSRLASAVSQLNNTHEHLQARTESLGDFLQKLSGVTRVTGAHGVAALAPPPELGVDNQREGQV